MHKIQVTAEVSDAFFNRYADEARREGVKVEALLEKTINCLLKEFEEEEEVVPVDPS
jgi:hypothetical protein